MARRSVAQFIPSASDVLAIGGPDPRLTREIMLAMINFLINKPANTRRVYRTGIRQFLDLTQWKDPRTTTLTDAAEYKRYLVNRGYSKSTVTTRLAAVDAFFAFLSRPDDKRLTITHNPFDFLERKDVLPDHKDTPPMTAEAAATATRGFQKMLNALPTDPIGLRDRAVLIFLAYTGRRRSEVAAMRIRDLHTGTKPRRYNVGDKTFNLPDEAYDAMRAHWVSSGRLKRLGPDSAVFGEVAVCPHSIGLDPERPLHHDVIWTILKRAAARAGISSKIKISDVRLLRGLNKRKVRPETPLLGLAWPSTTSRFLGQLRATPPGMDMRRVREAAVKVAGPIFGPS